MFEEIFAMVEHCAETFRDSARDAFGASIIADVLEPIRKEIGLLCSFHEEFRKQCSNIKQVLEEVRSFHLR
jgi:hypothetical protein